VKTQFFKHVEGGHAGLPKSSIYAPIKDHVEEMMLGKPEPALVRSAEDWAKPVIAGKIPIGK
jgi:hypothetical protein